MNVIGDGVRSDVMSHSFGEGYATRSDEEGFGGVYGGNPSIPKTEEDQLIHENHPGNVLLVFFFFFIFFLDECALGLIYYFNFFILR